MTPAGFPGQLRQGTRPPCRPHAAVSGAKPPWSPAALGGRRPLAQLCSPPPSFRALLRAEALGDQGGTRAGLRRGQRPGELRAGPRRPPRARPGGPAVCPLRGWAGAAGLGGNGPSRAPRSWAWAPLSAIVRPGTESRERGRRGPSGPSDQAGGRVGTRGVLRPGSCTRAKAPPQEGRRSLVPEPELGAAAAGDPPRDPAALRRPARGDRARQCPARPGPQAPASARGRSHRVGPARPREAASRPGGRLTLGRRSRTRRASPHPPRGPPNPDGAPRAAEPARQRPLGRPGPPSGFRIVTSAGVWGRAARARGQVRNEFCAGQPRREVTAALGGRPPRSHVLPAAG